MAVGPDARQRRGDQHPERQWHQLQASLDRRVALRSLEEEDEQEHERETRQPVDEGGGGGGGEQAVCEQVQVEHGRARAPLDEHPQRKQGRSGGKSAYDDPVTPAAEPAARDAEHEAGEPDHEARAAERVVAAYRIRLGQLAQHERSPGGAGERERHVEPEHPVPRDRDERAAEHGAEHEADCSDHRVGAHREPQLLSRESVGHERSGVCEQECRADALQHAPQDQDGAIGREPGAQRGERENQEAADVCALAAEQVAEAPRGQHQHGGGDEVGEDYPDEREQAGVQRALEIGQRDDQRPGVGRGEQHAQARARQRPPLVALVAGLYTEPRLEPGRACRPSSLLGAGARDGAHRPFRHFDVNVKITIPAWGRSAIAARTRCRWTRRRSSSRMRSGASS